MQFSYLQSIFNSMQHQYSIVVVETERSKINLVVACYFSTSTDKLF